MNRTGAQLMSMHLIVGVGCVVVCARAVLRVMTAVQMVILMKVNFVVHGSD